MSILLLPRADPHITLLPPLPLRMLGDASMVLSLEQISNIEDKNLLAGHTMVLLERDTAQAQVRDPTLGIL